jgi:uncharacterized membrane protein YdjX (TVP38/TMEM64 family)/rhodanese-related sulfurtransferase
MGTSALNGRAAARAALAALVSVAVLAAYLNRDALDAAALDAWLRQAGAWGPALFIAAYVLATVLFLPGALLTLGGGALFGPIWGTLYSLTGATIGATAAFAIARYVASDWVARRAGPRARRLIDGVEQEGWRFVALVRLVPLLPFNLLNYALGLTRIRLSHYVLASTVFMLPGALAYSYLGYAGREAFASGEDLVRKGLIALALLGAIAFLPRLLRRIRGTPEGEQISAAELRQRLAGREDITVLDVRPAGDYAGALGHIDASRNIPLDQLPRRLAELDDVRERPIAVICRTNRMSAQAAELLRRSGFSRVQLVADGMLGWQQHRDA